MPDDSESYYPKTDDASGDIEDKGDKMKAQTTIVNKAMFGDQEIKLNKVYGFRPVAIHGEEVELEYDTGKPDKSEPAAPDDHMSAFDNSNMAKGGY